MPTSKHKTKNMSKLRNTPLPETANCIIPGSEKSNLTKAWDVNFKIAIMNIFEDCKGDMNKYLSEGHENAKLNEIMQTIQDIKIGFNKK